MSDTNVGNVRQKKNLKINFFWQVCIEITNMLLPLVTSPILARRLGAESIGIYSYVYSISYYFVIAAALGMFQYGTREIARVRDDKNRLNERFSELLYSQLFVGIVVLFFFIFFAIFISRYPFLFLIEVINVIGSSVILINWLFSGLEEFQLIAVKTMIIRIIGVILIVTFVQTSADLPIYFLIMAAEPLAGAFVYIYLARNKVKIVRIKVNSIFRHISGMALLFIPVLTTYLYSSMDKVMLGQMGSMAELGYYENASKAMIAKNLATALSTVMVPRMSNLLEKDDNKSFHTLLNKTIDAVFLLTVAFGFGTAAISSNFSVVFWGKEFASCGPLIWLMSLTIPAYGLTYVVNNQYLVPTKKEKIYIGATVAGVAINFVLNFALIPHYYAYGATLATLITQYTVLAIECFIIRKDFSVLNSLKPALIYVLFGFVMMALVKYFELAIVPCSIIGLIVEIIVGAAVFMILAVLYWTVTSQNQYLNMLLEITERLFKK